VAATGASTKELMARMGHESVRAALIYQHASSERDVAIAEPLSAMAEEAMRRPGRQRDMGDRRGLPAEVIGWLRSTSVVYLWPEAAFCRIVTS
jgi:hypothetical protein